MKKSTKESLKNIISGLTLGIGIGLMVPKYAAIFQEYEAKKEAQIQVEEENRRIMDALMQDTNAQVSESAASVIDKISSINVDNSSMEALEITKEQLINAYKSYSDENHQHQYQSLYDEKTDSIKWDEAVKKIYENSQQVALKTEESIFSLETFSEEETQALVEEIRTTYEQIKKDFPEYDTRELACKLEYYSLLKSRVDRGTVIATTSADKIVYYPSYNKLRIIEQEDTTYHESFHLQGNNCVDNQENDYLSSVMPTFIEENYASLYAEELTGFYQMSYTDYNEALNLIQLSLALSDSYQIDELLKETIYNDPISFLKEFPVYGNDKEQFFFDTIEALRGLNILVNSQQASAYYYEDSTYTAETLSQVKTSTYEQISKIFYNNLIVLNEQHPEMTLEDNIAFVKLFLRTKINIPIDAEHVALKQSNDQETTSSYNGQEDSETIIQKKEEVLIESKQKIASNYFIEYIASRYNINSEDAKKQLFSVSEVSDDYTFPDFLGTEKKEFYQYIADKNKNQVFPESRQLVKQK